MRGRVSGIGVAVGFVGSLTALFVLGSFIDDGEAQQAFLPAAGMFFVFALPCFLLVREPRGAIPAPAASAYRDRSLSWRRRRAAHAERLTAGCCSRASSMSTRSPRCWRS